ncbi:chemotaxis protein CheX [Nocardioides humilatus]|uniref:Chemotaxis protein CheX n=1 Tax=Nocardioides humilatus TaxID=2607660 RepID=A0A5B1LAN2_9ACTN|nr:chemotaxis protein CheX [Nocardioides humilatus]KAA1417712.1 chemotaxis protein CheX [Nocardioides humilatus]
MTALAPELTDLQAVVEEVWSTFVGYEHPLCPRQVPPGTPLDASVWSGAVSVTGEWQGAVTVELADDVAQAISRVMLDLGDAETLADDDVADAVGELVNMIGGNVKSLMPGPSSLSLPAVAAGRAVFPSDAHEVARLDLTWTGEPVRITVHCPGSPR